MTAPEQMRMVGMVIGSIAQNSPPLVYCLHTNAFLEMRVEIVNLSEHDTSEECLRVLTQSLGNRVVGVFRNDSLPCWYYIQLDGRYPTHKIANWHLPLTVYFAQWVAHSPA